MKLSDKIQTVLRLKGLNTSKAERIMGVSTGTLTKVMERNAGWHNSTEDKFLRSFNVSPDWWRKQTGDVFINSDDSTQSSTSEQALIISYKLIDKLEEEVRQLREELSNYKSKSKT